MGEVGFGERVGGGEDQRAPLGQGRWGGVEGGGRRGGGVLRAVGTPCPAFVEGAVSPSLETGPWGGERGGGVEASRRQRRGEGGAFEERGAEHGSSGAAGMAGSAGHGARFITVFCGAQYPLTWMGLDMLGNYIEKEKKKKFFFHKINGIF